MKPAAALADRSLAVRQAARQWRRNGLLDDAGLAAVEQRFPDDRARVGLAFRILFFLFTLIAFSGVYGFVALAASALGEDGAAYLLMISGAGLVLVTEMLLGPARRRQSGVEAATSLLAIGCLLGGGFWVLGKPLAVDLLAHAGLLLAIAAAGLAAAAWRWGYSLYAGAAALALFGACARLPVGRLLWIAVPLAAAVPLLRAGVSPRLPPVLRRAATTVLVVAVVALYAAVHIDSWREQSIEALGGHSGSLSVAAAVAASGGAVAPLTRAALALPLFGRLLYWASAAATGLLPLAALLHGIRRRRLVTLLCGAAGLIVLVLTAYDHHTFPIPPWLALILGGSAAMGIALGVWRWLDAGPGAERHGFTAAAPLSADPARGQALEVGVSILTLPHPQPPAKAEPPGFAGGGGRSGGGGASGEF